MAQKTITGFVTDTNSNPLKDVLVQIKGYKTFATTDAAGKYILNNVPEKAAYLIFSLKGYEILEEEIKSRIVINVKLQKEAIILVDFNDEKIEFDDIVMEKEASLGSKRSNTMYETNAPVSYDYYGFTDDGPNTEEYSNIVENEYKETTRDPVSTFSIDVDNASYSNVRRFLTGYQMPPNDAVRIEEMINYFDYDYPKPEGEQPFSVYTEISEAPWNKEHQLLHIGIQGKTLNYEDLKPCNLVFLIDVSGSMSDWNKLPLVKESMKLLLDGLSKNDYISLVVYAGAAGVVLETTPATEKDKIIKALDNLSAGGSTACGEGISLAYDVCQKNLIQDGNNRVILCTDGDFNVGTSSTGDLVDLITEFRQKYDIYLTICGFGMGNYKDDRMEEISNAGNGNYFYIDTKEEAEKVFVKELRANLFTIAKDVKIQIEFNPYYVKAYRLIGYENRMLAKEDFDDDKKDAGELGAGHTVTAIYEIIPANSDEEIRPVGDLKYQQTGLTSEAKSSDELFTLKLRYKPIKSEKSILIEQVVKKRDIISFEKTSNIFKFSASVAAFGMLLRDSKFIENYTYSDVLNLAKISYKKDDQYQTEFLELVQKAEKISKNK